MERKLTGFGVLAGLVAGIAAFVYARIFIEPHVQAAVAYEEQRTHAESQVTGGGHDHEHEIFSRGIQENLGASVGTVVFAVAIGAMFAVAFIALWSYVGRRRPSTDPRLVAVALGAASFVAVIGVPFTVYPPNPPGVGDADTIGARSAAYLTLTLVSLALMVVAAALGFWMSRRVGGPWSVAAAAVAYLVGVTVTVILLPGFSEVPGPVVDGDTIVDPGFPGQVLADFRMAAVVDQAVLWTVLTAVFVALLGRLVRRRSEASPQLAEAVV